LIQVKERELAVRYIFTILCREKETEMKRSIITINEEKCTGCGVCVPDCPEGALQIIDGKARLVSDLFCDGLGACIKACPEDAMFIEEREAEPYDEARVMENIILQGPNTIKAHLQHLDDHNEDDLLAIAVRVLNEKGIPVPVYKETTPLHMHPQTGGCPGSQSMAINRAPALSAGAPISPANSELRQWPVQLKLLNPAAPYFDNADLLIAADCVPPAYGNFHQRFLKNRIVIMFCPKLDPYIDEYVEKLAAIFSMHEIKSIAVTRMEVPCCGGVNTILQRAMEKAGKSFFIKEYTISVSGEIV